MTEEKPQENKASAKVAHLKNALFIFTGLVLIASFYACLIHFTNMRFRIGFDPIALVSYRMKSAAASNDVERAHFHVSESERLVREVYKAIDASAHDKSGIDHYKKMIWHNEQATEHMLAAEASGTDLKQEGLIKRLCDSLRAQYILIAGVSPDDIDENRTLNARVEAGEDLHAVFTEIQGQLQTAMNW